MADLLPPSPSAVPTSKPSPSPSPLGPSTPADGAHSSPRTLPFTNAAASSSSTSLNSLSSLQNYSLSGDHSTPLSNAHARSHSFGMLQSSFASLPSDPSMGPALRPLDFAALTASDDAMHAELARTVDDLAQWLGVVEVGLTQMLETAGEPTIEEEQEQEDSGGGGAAALPDALAAYAELVNP